MKNSQFLVLVINYGVKCPVLFCSMMVNMISCSVAKEAGICHVTLDRYIKKHRDGIPSSIPSYNTEPKQVFSEAQESVLESSIKKAADIYFGLSPKDVRVLAFQCAKKFNIKMQSTWEEKECAGSDWLNGFQERHLSLSIRVPEPTSLARATSFNRENVKNVFEKLAKVMDRYKFTPNDIWNDNDFFSLEMLQEILFLRCSCSQERSLRIISLEMGRTDALELQLLLVRRNQKLFLYL